MDYTTQTSHTVEMGEAKKRVTRQIVSELAANDDEEGDRNLLQSASHNQNKFKSHVHITKHYTLSYISLSWVTNGIPF